MPNQFTTWIKGLKVNRPRLSSGFTLRIYFLVVSIGIYLAFLNWYSDDPFITYRYADNLRRGLGFIYNSGERVLSTTTPLFTLLLTFIGYFWHNVPHLANFLSAFSLVLGAILLWDLSKVYKTPFVGWASLLLYPTFPLLLNTIGAETALYLVFCLGTFCFYTRQNYRLTAICSALAVLTRPDGILVVLVIAIDYLVRNIDSIFCTRTKGWKTIPWVAILMFIIIAIPWFIFAWVYYGSPIPATLAAKQHQGSLSVSQRFAPGFLTIAGFYGRYWYYWLEGLFTFLGAFFVLKRWRRWALLLIWVLVYFGVYSLLGISRYTWYYAPLVPGMVILIGLGLQGLSTILTRCFQTNKPYVISAIPIGLLIVMAVFQSGDLLYLRQHPDPRYLIYQSIGNWLQVHTTPNDSVAALEIGIIGYYSHRTMVDLAGLLQPQIAAQLKPSSDYETAAIWALEQYHPNYLVLIEGGFENIEKNYVKQKCQPVEHFAGFIYNYSKNMNIYACR